MAATLPPMKYGDQGPRVRDFQDALRKTVDPSVGVDGIYGPQTEQFVQKAYAKYGIPGMSGVASHDLVRVVLGDAMNKPNSAIPPKPAEIAAMVAVAPAPPSKALMLGAAAGVAGLLWLVLKKK